MNIFTNCCKLKMNKKLIKFVFKRDNPPIFLKYDRL